ncbi:hypothetical protein D9756_002623 [Leucocoprinus leucothites]|uniref:Uncharacterized protein n=1 Tax=Leucocoprinus leucothites TaxID=201217 RepID=A0A8H5LLH1_9AGAR|nr:hypothetical protein D9756_002623 [Leucoagaricus leucothites]
MSESQSQPALSPTEALWAHVLRKDKLSLQFKSTDIPQVPTAPADRNATSTRILLYDTQARLEQFSSRADAMLKGMQDANHQLKSVGMLFEKDRDTLANDMIDLVNRSQREIQKAVGQPAQEPQSSAFQQKMELCVEGLNQRLDALQMFNQTHVQALETHSQILKSIQDQQNALLSAVLSLLPLAQALPHQLDQTKATIQDANATLTSAVTELKQDFTRSLSQLRAPSNSRKRRFSGASNSPNVVSKKPRIDSSTSPSSTSTKSAGKAIPTRAALLNLVPVPVKSPVFVRTTPAISSPAKILRQRSVFATPQPKPTPPNIPAISTWLSRETPTRQTSLLQRLTSPSQRHLPSALPQQTSVIESKSTEPASAGSPSRSRPPKFGQLKAQLSTSKALRARSARESIIGSVNATDTKSTPRPTVVPSPLSSTRTMFNRPLHPLPARPSGDATLPPPRQPGHTGLNLPAGLMLYSTPSSSFGLRNVDGGERRLPPRDGRRFIPLDDDDDDDDEDM